MGISFLALVICFAQVQVPSGSQPEAPISKQVCPEPTGKNGYEDYLYAVDIVHSPAFASFEAWESYRTSYKTRSGALTDPEGKPVPVPPTPAGLTLDSSVLQIRSVKAKLFDRVIDLVRQGNAKPCSFPRKEINIATLFPELTYFRSIAKFIVASAYASFADGRSAEGTEKLLTGLKFAAQISVGPLITDLVAIACRAIVLAQFEENLPQLSEADCQRVIGVARELLQRPIGYSKTLELEREADLKALDLLKAGSADLRTMGEMGTSDGFGRAIEAMAKLPVDQQNEILQSARTSISLYYQKLIAHVSGPEKDLVVPVESGPEFDVETVQDWTPDNISKAIRSIFLPLFAQAGAAEAKARIQLRLLLLHGRVLDYKWINGQLPKKLRDAAPAEEAFDVFTDQDFAYELKGTNGYRLYSKGFGSVGEIELKYRRSQSTESPLRGDGEMPPPLR